MSRQLTIRWKYTGVTGALVFCVDKAKGGLFFRVVNLSVSGASGTMKQGLRPSTNTAFVNQLG